MKIIIKEALDAILKDYNRLDNGQYIALLNQFTFLRESVERNAATRRYISDHDADGIKAVAGFMFEAHMIRREQREKLWAMVDTIQNENKEVRA